MLPALLFSALLMGLAGAPHCVAMCGAACRAAAGPGQWGWFHTGRLAGYACAGAVAAASMGTLARWAASLALLKPLWTTVHIAALALGLWLLWHGRQPAWMSELRTVRTRAGRSAGWQVIRGPGRSATAGLVWVAMPCGLLQSALLVAALANSAAEGAVVMAGFAVSSGLGVALGPLVWARLAAPAVAPAAWAGLSTRLAGAALAGASAWALGHGLWQRAVAWCLS